MQELYFRFTVTSFLEIGFGREVDGINEDLEFTKAFDSVQNLMIGRFLCPCWRIERWFGVTEREKSIAKKIKFLNDYAARCIKERRANVNQGKNRDLISRWILNAKEQGKEVSDDHLRDILFNFLIAGRDTTACLLAWTLYRLIKHPSILATCRQEIKTEQAEAEAAEAEASGDSKAFPKLQGKKGLSNRKASYGELKNLKYLEAVLCETLRLHPPIPNDIKMAVEDDTLPDGTFIPKGTVVAYRPYVFGRSELLWKDPERFDPERWLNGEVQSQYKFIAFNAGPRICLGKNVALLEAKTLMGTILPRYNFELLDENVTYSVGLVLRMKNGLQVRLTKREAD